MGGGGPGRAAGRLGAQAGAGGGGRKQAGIDGCGWILVGVGGQGAHGVHKSSNVMRPSGPKWVHVFGNTRNFRKDSFLRATMV